MDESTLTERLVEAIADLMDETPSPAEVRTLRRVIAGELAADEARTAAMIEACEPAEPVDEAMWAGPFPKAPEVHTYWTSVPPGVVAGTYDFLTLWTGQRDDLQGAKGRLLRCEVTFHEVDE